MMNKTKDVAAKDAAAKDAAKRPSAPKKLRCNGCNRPSDDIACPSCLASNGRKCERFGCNRNLPANGKYNYCKACSCSSHNCPNAIVSGEAYCQQCIDGWKVTCYICSKRRATVSFQTCKPCDEARKMCEKCRKFKVSFDQDSKTFLKFCSRCLCKNCTNLHQADSDYCETCAKCLCSQCGRGFSDLGSDMCHDCIRRQTQPCGNVTCKGLAGFDMTSHTFYDFCRECTCRGCGQLNNGSENRLCASCRPCVALNCFRVTADRKYEYCGRCNEEYRSGKVKCIGKNCKLYTKKESGICGACTANGVIPVPIPHKTEPAKPASAPAATPAKPSTLTAPAKASSPAAPVAATKPVEITKPAKSVVISPPLPVAPVLATPVASAPPKAKLPATMTMTMKGATVVVIPSPDCAAEEFDAVALAIRGLAPSSDEASSPTQSPGNPKATRRARTKSSAHEERSKVQWGDDDRCAA